MTGWLYQVWDWEEARPHNYYSSLAEAEAAADRLNAAETDWTDGARYKAGEAND